MNVRIDVRGKSTVALKRYRIIRYLYYVLIRGYYYALLLLPYGVLAVVMRYILHPFIFKKETRFNKYIRSALLWMGGWLQSAVDYRAHLPVMRVILDYLRHHIEPIKNRSKPLVYLGWCVSPEFLRAFDVHYIIPEAFSVMGSWLGQEISTHMLEVLESEGGSIESCSASKFGAGAYFTGQMPDPDLIVTSSHPCDSGVAFYPTLQNLAGVPMYVLDTPYGTDEDAYRYFAKNLRSMIQFIEKHTGQKINRGRLKSSCEELNKTNFYLQELTAMTRAIPSPVSSQQLTVAWAMKLMGSGSPHLTEMARIMYENAKARLERGQGWLKEEKIRVIWWDVPIAFISLYPWIEKEFGAMIVGGDLMGRCNTPYVDTSSEESMMLSLARVHLNASMVRNVRGTYELFMDEFEQIISEYSGDCFIFVGHNGCKHGWGYSRIKKDVCRRIGLPALHMSSDYSDCRNTSEESLKKQISDFFISNGLA